jgi:putative nicotinate phosphoribosyltransferase
MGTRRTHEEAAIAAARAAYVAGFSSTSNLAAGHRYGIPTVGTAAHAFILGHASEAAAFRSQVEAQGVGTTLLVDTYDIPEGIRTAVEVAGPGLGAIRIDSGDLAVESHKARALLDELGATETRIIATSDLDEFVITELRDAPIDAYGVGTRLVTGSGHPTAAMVYKLVQVDDRPVAKTSAAKVSVGGRKTVHREYDGGVLTHESFSLDEGASNVQVAAVRGGTVVHRPSLTEIREHASAALATLPESALDVSPGDPYLTVRARGEQP